VARNRHETAQPVVLAIDRVADGAAALSRSSRLGVLTNRSARTADGLWTGDVLLDRGYRVALFLTPEHGLAVDAPAGAAVAHAQVDAIPVLSMYGADAGPVEEAMSTIDALVVDLPDVGCRYYTYAWTVREVLKRAARHDRPVIVLDRPNPLGGLAIEGNIPDPRYDSPVCASPRKSAPLTHPTSGSAKSSASLRMASPSILCRASVNTTISPETRPNASFNPLALPCDS